MRARMIAHDADNALFKETLAKAVEAGIFKGRLTAIIDSSPVHGAGAVADTYELVRKLWPAAGRPGTARAGRAGAVAEPFGGAKPDIDWQDPAARKEHLGELVEAARVGMAELDEVADPEVAEPAGLLAQVIDADTEADRRRRRRAGSVRRGWPATGSSRLRPRDAPRPQVLVAAVSTATSSTSSPTRTPSWCWASRCGPATPATGREPPRCRRRCDPPPGVEVDTLLGDMAYSDGDVRAGVGGTGRGAGGQGPAGHQRRPLPQNRLLHRPGRREVTCPAGESPPTPARPDHKGRPGLLFHFDPAECAICPLRADCTAADGGRTIIVGLHHHRIAGGPGRPGDPQIKPCCAGGPKWNARSTTSRTSACAKPATGADAKPNFKPFWPPPSPTSTSRRPRRPRPSHPHRPGRLSQPGYFLATPPPTTPQAALSRHRPATRQSLADTGPEPPPAPTPSPKRALPADSPSVLRAQISHWATSPGGET